MRRGGEMIGNTYVKRIMVPLLLISVLLLLLVPGCKEKEATEPTATLTPTATGELSQEQMQQILADTMLAVKNAKSYKSDINMTMDMEATGGAQAGKVNVVMTTIATYDQENKNMQMSMNMNMDMETDIDMSEMEEDMQNISMEMYLFEENMYMKMDMPMIGEQWVKMPANEQMMAAYDIDMVSQQLEMLEGPGRIEFLRYEAVDGADCYVFKIVPDMKKIMEWVGQQRTTGTEIPLDNIADIADIFKDISYFVWITRDGGLMKKMDASLLMEFNAEQFGAKDGDFDSMKMKMDMGMRMYDYNKPVAIVLPEEAKDAIDMSEIGNLGQ